ncbi:PXA domain-containing protein [Cercophora scortea]|uniref:PXA domain-containing protein n=1 Tax=Cercophora scortea TaxID=314031 RepID=A0AAE0MDZ9_9PEZI|nr:PXA domain-containing protein [Cercophora scortea]
MEEDNNIKADTAASDAPETSSQKDEATIGATADEDVPTRLFRFLSTATPRALGGVALGLAGTTYFVFGQLGLVLIGAFGGILAFIQWEQRNAEVARAIRGERGMDVLARLLEARKEGTETAREEQDQESALIRRFDDFQPETREALNELVEAVVRDYVRWWYAPIVPSDKFFPLACRKTLASFIIAVSNHLSKKRPADAFLDFLTNSSSIVIVFFSELSSAFAELPADSSMSAVDAISNYRAAHPDSNLSNLLNQSQQASKFRMVAEDLLNYLDRNTYECDPARVFLREILAGVVLEMSLQTCSKPEWINGWIVYLLEAGEPDFSQVIDEGMQTGPGTDAVFADFDGNVGNIGLAKGNKNSFDQERARRRESAHKKKLSKAEEEMDAMEEVRRLNQMIADEDARRSKESLRAPEQVAGSAPREKNATAAEASERLADAFKRNADELEIKGSSEQRVAARSEPQTKYFSKILSNGSPVETDAADTPPTPISPLDSRQTPSPRKTESRFTSFDQIVPPARDDPEADEEEPRKPAPLTLHNATITILDEPDNGRIRMKPTWDYLVQIEPANSIYPGWMIVRKYSDFERLHEVLRRIAAISGATAFSEQHNTLPSWKVHTRTSLRAELERYVRGACWYQTLAESEGMKKFLEKDQTHNYSRSKAGFQAFEKIGKNVFDVLTSAPMEGSKAIVGGMTDVLGNMGLGQRKPTASTPPASNLQDVTAASRLSMTLPRLDSSSSLAGSRKARESIDSQRSVVSTQPAMVSPMERRPSYDSRGEIEPESLRLSRPSPRNSRETSRTSSLAPTRSPSSLSFEGLKLPPPPDAITDDYEAPPAGQTHAHSQNHQSHSRSQTMPALSGTKDNSPPRTGKQYAKLSEPETRVAVELLFAVINEMYTLSSAWNIRRTLLAAAKSFLLRPGNPSLTSIQNLIQTSVLDANISDSGLAAHLKRIRENTLPTEEERAAWPAEMTDEEKEKLRVKARKLLIESGVPAALMGVMGQSATSEALGRLFDCLQIEEVARGLMFGLVLQAARTITH